MQASLTNFQYISSEWSKNCKEEALLGVSMTGQLDNKMMLSMSDNSDLLLPSSLPNILETVKNKTIEVNAEWAKKLGINPAAAITCVKPSGTVSQLTDAASGMHPRHSQYYIRTVRADIKDPLCQMMQEAGFPSEPCVMRPDHTRVFSFPMKSPDGCLTRNDLTAIEHLNLWLTYQRHWCEHKPSITITVREHEWMDVGAWVYEHFDEVSGISFLPHSDHSYKQAPYQDCTKEEYETLLAQMPKNVNWSDLSKYEKEDRTAGSQTYACSGDKCEMVDLTSS
jgi:ribonucleoside-triphosphate reductase